MALRGIKVLEMAGLAPAPYCGMILSDFGADVIRVDRTGGGGLNTDSLCRGKRSIAVNLKKEQGISLVKRMCRDADVLIEPFRRGVMEKLGIGPSVLLKENPRLVYARLTGFGQHGPLADRAGHDINYLAISGTLSALGRHGDKPYAPVNLLADFAGGGLMCAMGITMALYERIGSGQGQVIDANMVEGAAYVGSFLWATNQLPVLGKKRGTGWLDGGAPWYDTYETSDGLYMSVGAIEPQFYTQLLDGLGVADDDWPQFDDWPQMKAKFTELFKSKSQKEWTDIFEDRDACVMPIVPMHQVAKHRHNVARDSFNVESDGSVMPKPAPLLSRTPGVAPANQNLAPGQHTQEVLKQFGCSEEEMKSLLDDGAVSQANTSKL